MGYKFVSLDSSESWDEGTHRGKLQKHGIEIRNAGPRELQLDCDSGFNEKRVSEMLDLIYRKLGVIIRITEIKESHTSGHCHVYLRANVPLPIWLKPALQVMLGSSIARELNIIRCINNAHISGKDTSWAICTYSAGWKDALTLSSD